MTELEKLAYTRTYVEKLANGINPLTDQAVPEGDLLNNVRISRCLFYVCEVLRQVVENGGIPSCREKKERQPFRLDDEDRRAFRYSDIPLPISEVTKRINELIDPQKTTKLSYVCLLDWLEEIGLLTRGYDETGKIIRQPTDRGLDLGIAAVQQQSARGPYRLVVYNRTAQQFILDNLDQAAEWINGPQKRRRDKAPESAPPEQEPDGTAAIRGNQCKGGEPL